MFSGGIGSWATAKRVVAGVGRESVTLLFADTLVEDADTYRFLNAAARNVGSELVTVADGRTPFEVFHDDRFLGNQRLANCSKYLKQKPCREWLDANCDPERDDRLRRDRLERDAPAPRDRGRAGRRTRSARR
jgi:3'-phosphoadenosine 5'-phosphosulfate sulfotransferase (PAPS reductase)/FAD synthetase